MPDAADSLRAVADYFGVPSNNQQHFVFVEEANFCTLVGEFILYQTPSIG